jgi:hypothetical protein
MNLLDKFFITEINLVSQIRPQIKDLTLSTPIQNIRLILRDLPESTKHDIGYRNAWLLLTGRTWE